jgi:hypothetical protein
MLNRHFGMTKKLENFGGFVGQRAISLLLAFIQLLARARGGTPDLLARRPEQRVLMDTGRYPCGTLYIGHMFSLGLLHTAHGLNAASITSTE